MPLGSPSLRELRRATADKVAPFELVRSGVEQSLGPGLGYTYVGTELTGLRRRLASSDLASMDATGLNPENPPDYLKNEWVYLCADPPEQRRIPEGGFTGYARADEVLVGFDPALTPADTPVAYLDVERPFRAVVQPNLEVEVHGIPPLRAGKSVGIHEHVRHALRVILRSDTVLVTGVTGQSSIDVTATFPWLSNANLFVGAQYVGTTAGVETYAIAGATLRFDGDRVILRPNTTVSTGQETPVSVLRPLLTWVRPNGNGAQPGAWAESVTGPLADDDQVLGDTDAIALVAAWGVCEEQATACAVGSAEQRYWLAKGSAFAARSVFLRDQRVRKIPTAGASMFPDFVSVDGPFRGRYGPGF